MVECQQRCRWMVFDLELELELEIELNVECVFGLRLSRFICGLILVLWARLKKVVRFDVGFFVYVRFVCEYV